MICDSPFVKGVRAFPCGKCVPCLLKRRKIWMHRLMLESLLHGDKTFMTLTYSDEKLPLTPDGKGTLEPGHIRDFLKRLRYHMKCKLRFYCAGEYGDESWRPHYHLIVYGYPNCLRGMSMYSKVRTKCCSSCDGVKEIWGYGNVFLAEVSEATAMYTAGYLMKKLTRFDNPLLEGRHPEFARMSLKPGLGADALHDVGSVLMQHQLEVTLPDVPSGLRHGPRVSPYGRYLRKKLRVIVGKDEKAPLDVEQEKEVFALLARSIASKEGLSVGKQLAKENKGASFSLQGKMKLKQRRSL